MSPAPSRRCPICRGPLLDDAAQQPVPFCSPRCRAADLGNWLNGRYVIADQSSELGLTPDEQALLQEIESADE